MSDHLEDESAVASVSPWEARGSLIRSIAHRLAGDREVLPVEGRLASFDRATSWLNSEPSMPGSIRINPSSPRTTMELVQTHSLCRTQTPSAT